MEWLSRVSDFVFGCHHSNLSRVFTIDRRTYRACCGCAATFDYSLETMSMDRRAHWSKVTGGCRNVWTKKLTDTLAHRYAVSGPCKSGTICVAAGTGGK